MEHIPDPVLKLQTDFNRFYNSIRDLAEQRGWNSGPMVFHFRSLEVVFKDFMNTLMTCPCVPKPAPQIPEYWLPQPEAPACRVILLDTVDEIAGIVIESNPQHRDEAELIVESFRNGAMRNVEFLLRDIWPQA